jgi:uncharacterized protein YecE (DUF72 family)
LPSVPEKQATVPKVRKRSASGSSAEGTLEPAAAPAGVFAGTSGWAYPTWKPGFYPDGLAAKKFLPFYSSQMNSVEVNYTFRALPSVTMLSNWLASVGDGFRFSFKAPQRITHFKRLKECEADVTQFVEVLAPVRDARRLGLLLFQLPPNFKADPERLEAFLRIKAIAGEDAPPIAFEFRHESWFNEEIYAVLRMHNAALCIAESDDLATPEVHTARTHTSFRLRRAGGYGEGELKAFARRFVALAQDAEQPREVYVYFKHEDEPSGALNGTAFLREAVAVAAHGGRGR